MTKVNAPEAELNRPHSVGLYWARKSGFKFWNYIIRVYGDYPFLKIDLYDLQNHRMTHDATWIDIKEVGPQIFPGEMPNVEGDRKDFYPV